MTVLYTKEKEIQRFLAKVKKTETCWLWIGNKMPKGYGLFRRNNRRWLAHRVSYDLFIDRIDPKICVLHKCDNPSCIKPEHLFLGTQGDNIRDCVAKGRFRVGSHRGESNPAAKINGDTAEAINILHKQGWTQAKIVRVIQFIKKSQVYNIVHGKNWRS